MWLHDRRQQHASAKITARLRQGGMLTRVQIAREYEQGGAACLSVLTDARYFQGSFDFLEDIRRAGVSCPLLCKEFIVEAYQLYKVRGGAHA